MHIKTKVIAMYIRIASRICAVLLALMLIDTMASKNINERQIIASYTTLPKCCQPL